MKSPISPKPSMPPMTPAKMSSSGKWRPLLDQEGAQEVVQRRHEQAQTSSTVAQVESPLQ